MGVYDFCGAMVLRSKIKNQKGDLILEKINKSMGWIIRNKLEQFEQDTVANYKLTDEIRDVCSYDNVKCKVKIFNELMYGVENKLIDDVIDDLKNKPMYYFYEIYADPACPQVFKQMSADDFFFFSCYIHGMSSVGNCSRKELYKVCKELYEEDFAHFIRVIRRYGYENS